MERGVLEKARFLSYIKLKAENKYSMDAEGCLAAKEAKFKKIAKANRKNQKKG